MKGRRKTEGHKKRGGVLRNTRQNDRPANNQQSFPELPRTGNPPIRTLFFPHFSGKPFLEREKFETSASFFPLPMVDDAALVGSF